MTKRKELINKVVQSLTENADDWRIGNDGRHILNTETGISLFVHLGRGSLSLHFSLITFDLGYWGRYRIWRAYLTLIENKLTSIL